MKRITKTSTTDASRKDKAKTGKKTSVVPNVVGMSTPSSSPLSEFKVSNLSCKDGVDDFQEDVPSAISSLNNHADVNEVCTIMSLVGADAIGFGSCSEEVLSDESNEGVLCALSKEGTDNEEFMNGAVNPQILECRSSMSQVLDVEDRSDRISVMKMEPFEMTQTDYVKFEKLCICTCHFGPVNSCCSDTPEAIDNSLDVNNSDASVFMDGIVRDVTCRLSSVVVGTIDTHIVGRKFSMGTVCEEGMSLAFVRDADNPKDSNAVKVGVTAWLLSFLICLILHVEDIIFLAYHIFVTIQNYLY